MHAHFTIYTIFWFNMQVKPFPWNCVFVAFPPMVVLSVFGRFVLGPMCMRYDEMNGACYNRLNRAYSERLNISDRKPQKASHLIYAPGNEWMLFWVITAKKQKLYSTEFVLNTKKNCIQFVRSHHYSIQWAWNWTKANTQKPCSGSKELLWILFRAKKFVD